MTYSLWSRGRLLGESPLDFARCMPGLLVGFLRPTPLGEKLLPVASGVTPASLAFSKLLHTSKPRIPEEQWHLLPEHADYVSACDEEAALALELRGPDGKVIPTEDIAVRDTEFLMAWSEAQDHELLAADAAGAITELDDEDERLPWKEDDDAFDEDALIAELEALATDESECWRQQEESRWMRYQLQVQLIHDWSIP
jgi:hypothetical protein